MAALAPGAVTTPATLPVTGLLQLLASVLLLSSAWPLAKLAMSAGATPLWFAEGRAVLSGVMVCGLVALRGGIGWPGRSDLPAILAVGGLQLGAFFVFTYAAVAWLPAGRTAILANTTTIWVVPLSLIFLREHVPPGRWIAAALGLAGIVVLINPLSIDWSSRNVLIGHVFLLGASLSWAIAIIVTRRARPSLSMLALLPWCFLVASVMLLPMVVAQAPHGTFGRDPVAWWGLIYVGVVAGPLGTWFILEATARLPAMVSSVGFLTTPAVGLIMANLLLHEPLTADLLTGSGLIMAGVACAALPGRLPARRAG